MTLGECYLDHYEAFLGDFTGRSVFQLDGTSPSIQILEYENVFSECMVFCSLGFSHFSPRETKQYQEIVLVADNCFDEIPSLLVNTLFFLSDRRIPLVNGLSKGGLGDLNQNFVSLCGKDALYFTDPFPFPSEFEQVKCGKILGYMHLAVFISQQEHMLVKEEGAATFEKLMGDREIDPFHLERESVEQY